MIERMLIRFKGCDIYRNGVKYTRLVKIQTDSLNFTTTILNQPNNACPILATLKTTKFKMPYEDEKPFHFEISYKNQNDETHTAYCVIPIYAKEGLDFRIVMQEENDFVKEIISISPRTGYTEYKGDLNDIVEIIGLDGNIAKIQGAISIMLSDVLYNIRLVTLQRYVEIAFGGGLKRLAQDYGLSLGSTFTQVNLRLFTRLFSTFVVPSKSVMQESMSAIYQVLDPEGYIIVEPEYSDSYYKMFVNIYTSVIDFTTNDISIILLFTERYRPVPASIITKINFNNRKETDFINDEGSVEITESLITMSTITFMSSSTIMGSGNVVEPNFPATYP